MNPRNYIEIVNDVMAFLSDRTLIQLIKKGNFDEIADLISQAEKSLNRYGVLSGQRRPALLFVLILGDLGKIKDANKLLKRIDNIKIILNDIIQSHRLMTGGPVQVNGFKIKNGLNLEKEFVRNLSTGLSQSQSRKGSKAPYRSIKPYLANNHLLGRLLRSPEYLTGNVMQRLTTLKTKFGYEAQGVLDLVVTLENMPYQGKKIDDIYTLVYLPNLRLNVNGTPVDLSDVMPFIRITGDSKFYKYPNQIKYEKVIFQQAVIYVGDRMTQLWDVYRSLKGQFLNLSEIEDVLDELIPIIFQHYVIIPSDKSIAANVGADYAEVIRTHFGDHLRSVARMDDPDQPQEVIDMILRAGNKYIDEHFVSGNFVLKHEILYEDL